MTVLHQADHPSSSSAVFLDLLQHHTAAVVEPRRDCVTNTKASVVRLHASFHHHHHPFSSNQHDWIQA